MAEDHEVGLFDLQSSRTGYTLNVFGIVPPRRAEELPASVANSEVTEWLVLTEPTELAFPNHTDVMADFFAGKAALS